MGEIGVGRRVTSSWDGVQIGLVGMLTDKALYGTLYGWFIYIVKPVYFVWKPVRNLYTFLIIEQAVLDKIEQIFALKVEGHVEF